MKFNFFLQTNFLMVYILELYEIILGTMLLLINLLLSFHLHMKKQAQFSILLLSYLQLLLHKIDPNLKV